jgi:DNA-directed RNA polymerase specialized sigma24 family protein
MASAFLMGNRQQENPAVFHARFSRCSRLLHFIACRVLGGCERAGEAIENSWLRASWNPPRFEYEGAFRSWLVRVLIDEALAILREKEQNSQPKVSHEPKLVELFRKDAGTKGRKFNVAHHVNDRRQ